MIKSSEQQCSLLVYLEEKMTECHEKAIIGYYQIKAAYL